MRNDSDHPADSNPAADELRPEQHNPMPDDSGSSDIQPSAEHPEDSELTVPASGNLDPAEDSLRKIYNDYFVEYFSYVIKDRAIPDVDDGLKPVQRRILHALSLIDDGRYHKVANVVGSTMQFHPHGDASIGDALVVLTNKRYYIDGQGNYGNILTGDCAAASRYIECRLTPLAKEVLFNKDITVYTDSYDGRNQEPVCLPAKVPSLLMLGTDGIAVGMATHIFPHNFRELLEAQIAILENRPFRILPDFQQGGIMDASEYDDGKGKIRLRARIEPDGDKKVIIREIPAGSTTESLIASIERAVRQGKLKISSINDYTAENVEIEINLARGVYAEQTIKELYAYTNCELTAHSTLLVIKDNKPAEMTVTEVLHRNTEKLQEILRRELEIAMQRHEDRFHDKSLARIFIENRIYKRIETCQTMEKIFAETRKGLEKFRSQLHRDILDEDIEKLLQIPIRRISLFDLNKNSEELDILLKEMEKVAYKLDHLTEHTVEFLQHLLEKYGPLFPRMTQIEDFESVSARDIARRSLKVYHDKVNYFLGTNVKASNKNDEPLLCSPFDKLMLLKNDGTCKVINISEKEYIGQTKYVFVVDKDQVYSILYRDRQEGTWFVKRFQMDRFILEREYQIIPENCLIDSLYTNRSVVVRLDLVANNRRSYNSITVDFDSYPLRSRKAKGFKLTHYPVTGITVLNRGTAEKETSDQESQDDKPADADNAPAPTAAPDQVTAAPDPEPVEKKTEPERPASKSAVAEDNKQNAYHLRRKPFKVTAPAAKPPKAHNQNSAKPQKEGIALNKFVKWQKFPPLS